jgi:hypothetical protein
VLPDPVGTKARWSSWVVGHIKDRALYPELTWEPSNWRPEHRACSDASGQSVALAKAKLEALVAAGITDPATLTRILAGQTPVFSGGSGPGKPSPLPSLSPGDPSSSSPAPGGPIVALLDSLPPPFWSRRHPGWAPWLGDVMDLPSDAAPPLAMSARHPDAVGSYGADAAAWIESNLKIKLRWWQRLCLYRILEHDKTGRLTWRSVILSAPRRAGKSVLLRGLALWRIEHADLVGEKQTVMFVSKDLPTGREIFLGAKPYAERRKDDGWKMRESNGTEEVAAPTLITTDSVDDAGEVVISRWLLRSPDSCYGYDVSLAQVDESWGIKPTAISEGLEPALLERLWRQLLMVSTAHPSATSLMRRRLLTALRELEHPKRRLVLLWSARPSADPSDPEVWRAASPHWSEDRAEMMEDKYAEALAGEIDPEFDDLQPMESFTSQYLNVWRLREHFAPGDPITTPEAWAELAIEPPARKPDAVAVESWFGDAVAVVEAWAVEGGAVVHSYALPDVETAAAAIAAGYRGRVHVGKSLADHPAWATHKLAVEPQTMTPINAVMALQRLITDDAIRHTGADVLDDQVLELRTKATPNGVRLVSAEGARADAVKAAAWAATAARARGPRKRRRVYTAPTT